MVKPDWWMMISRVVGAPISSLSSGDVCHSVFSIMAAVQTNSVSFDRALAREKARQKRKRQGGKKTQLSDRLAEHDYDQYFDPVELAVPPVKKTKTPDPPVSSVDDDCDRAVQSILKLCRSEVPEVLSSPQHVVLQEGYSCPFHYTSLHSRTTDSNWQYYKCPVQSCVFFCGADRIADWVMGLSRDLHPCYKEQSTADLQISLPFTCYCHCEGFHDLKLKKSQTAKNPNRFFLCCKNNPSCKFFRWLDLPFSDKQKKLWNVPQ